MNSILKKINSQTLVLDIDKFLEPILSGDLGDLGKIESLKIQTKREAGSSQVQYRASITILQDALDNRFVKRFNDKLINGRECHYKLRLR